VPVFTNVRGCPFNHCKVTAVAVGFGNVNKKGSNVEPMHCWPVSDMVPLTVTSVWVKVKLPLGQQHVALLQPLFV